MKEAELRAHAKCSLCGRQVLSGGLPLFWRVTVERFGVDLAACRRQDGLATHLGSTRLAEAMGPGEDLAKPVMEPVTATVCEPCALRPLPVALLAEGRQ